MRRSRGHKGESTRAYCGSSELGFDSFFDREGADAGKYVTEKILPSPFSNRIFGIHTLCAVGKHIRRRKSRTPSGELTHSNGACRRDVWSTRDETRRTGLEPRVAPRCSCLSIPSDRWYKEVSRNVSHCLERRRKCTHARTHTLTPNTPREKRKRRDKRSKITTTDRQHPTTLRLQDTGDCC